MNRSLLLFASSLFAVLFSCNVNVALTDVCADPEFDPPSGTSREPFTLTITTDTPDAVIYYNLNNVTPTTASTVYTDPIAIDASTMVTAVVMKEDCVASNVVYAEYGVGWTVETFAGYPDRQGTRNGTGSEATFGREMAMTASGGMLYIADLRNSIIRRLDIATRAVTTIAGTPLATGFVDAVGLAARFDTPSGIATDGAFLYISDAGNDVIRRLALATNEVTTFATFSIIGSQPGAMVRYGSSLFVYAYESAVHRLWRVDLASGVATSVLVCDGSIGGLTTDGTQLYATMDSLGTVIRIDPSSFAVTTIAGTAGSSGFADGIGAEARFMMPFGIDWDGAGLLVSDCDGRTVRSIGLSTYGVSTIAGSPLRIAYQDGVGRAVRFGSPSGVAWDGTSLFVVDEDYCTIRRVY